MKFEVKKVSNYLNQAGAALGGISDEALARKLGLQDDALAAFRSGAVQITDYHAAKLALIIGINPIEIIASREIVAEKDESKRNFWIELWLSEAGVV